MSGSFQNKNITDEISPVHKKLLSVETEFREQNKQSNEIGQEYLAEMKSMTQDEAKNSLVCNIVEGRFKFAIDQLIILR